MSKMKNVKVGMKTTGKKSKILTNVWLIIGILAF